MDSDNVPDDVDCRLVSSVSVSAADHIDLTDINPGGDSEFNNEINQNGDNKSEGNCDIFSRQEIVPLVNSAKAECNLYAQPKDECFIVSDLESDHGEVIMVDELLTEIPECNLYAQPKDECFIISDSESDHGEDIMVDELLTEIPNSGTDDSFPYSTPKELIILENQKENFDEIVRQLDIRMGSQRIIDEDSDTDEISLEHVIDLDSNDSVEIFVPKPISVKKERAETNRKLSGSRLSTKHTAQPISSQLIDIEMEALALEMSLSEKDLNEQPTTPAFEPTDINFDEGFQYTVVPKRRIIQTIPRSRSRRSYLDPLPLMIEDVLRLLRGPLAPGRLLAMFGLNFNKIAIYGRCSPLSYSSGGNPNTTMRRLYEVDDGTASVSVWFNHLSVERVEFLKEVQQVQQKLTSSRSKIEESTYADLLRIMQNVRSNDRVPKSREFRLGANVLVLGRVRWSFFRNQVQVNAYEIYEDDRNCRDLELAFKANLANMYETRFQLDDVGDL